jgi:RNA polymerase sigma-70 factor (ECF subfamily)
MAGDPLVISTPTEGVAERIGRGDPAAFEEFFRAEYARLCSFLLDQVGSAAEAEEIAQEVLLRLWHARGQLREHGSIRSYLYRSARNAAINHRRRAALEREHSAAGHVPVAPCAPADERLRLRLLAEAATAAIRELPERCRLIFDMSRRRHLSHAEIAEALDISPRTVETQIGRALKLLRRRLAPLLD